MRLYRSTRPTSKLLSGGGGGDGIPRSSLLCTDHLPPDWRHTSLKNSLYRVYIYFFGTDTNTYAHIYVVAVHGARNRTGRTIKTRVVQNIRHRGLGVSQDYVTGGVPPAFGARS